MIRKAFEPQRLEEERAKDKSRVFAVRLNKQDEAVINELKELFDIKSESTILKLAAYQYLNVLHHGISAKYLRYLFKKDRQRLSDYRAID